MVVGRLERVVHRVQAGAGRRGGRSPEVTGRVDRLDRDSRPGAHPQNPSQMSLPAAGARARQTPAPPQSPRRAHRSQGAAPSPAYRPPPAQPRLRAPPHPELSTTPVACGQPPPRADTPRAFRGKDGHVDVDLVVPMKHPRDGKSRLRGAVEADRHPGLVLALAADTLAAVTSAGRVRRVLLVAADPAAVAELAELGVEIVAEPAASPAQRSRRRTTSTPPSATVKPCCAPTTPTPSSAPSKPTSPPSAPATSRPRPRRSGRRASLRRRPPGHRHHPPALRARRAPRPALRPGLGAEARGFRGGPARPTAPKSCAATSTPRKTSPTCAVLGVGKHTAELFT